MWFLATVPLSRDLSTQAVLCTSLQWARAGAGCMAGLSCDFDIFADGGVYLERPRHNLITQHYSCRSRSIYAAFSHLWSKCWGVLLKALLPLSVLGSLLMLLRGGWARCCSFGKGTQWLASMSMGIRKSGRRHFKRVLHFSGSTIILAFQRIMLQLVTRSMMSPCFPPRNGHGSCQRSSWRSWGSSLYRD